GCYSDTTKTIIINKAPDIILIPRDTMGCIPFTLTFAGTLADTSVPFDSWLWDFGDGTTSSDFTVNHTYSNKGNYHVNFNIMYGDSACTKDTVINIKTFKWPVANFIFEPEYPYLHGPVVNFINQSSNANFWHWNFGNGDTSILKNPAYNYQQSGEYTITLIVNNEAECTDTAYRKMYVSPEEFVKVPEAFSPNGDGQNDEFYLFYAGNFVSIEFRIFNRWGEMVFETTDIKQGWDGIFKGKPQETGGYSYYVRAKTASSETPVFIKGTLTLIR
ncbi:MAG: T9SS type B sorting domain-containing protein, partial [Bacteroidetes bacterium]|nr:T9SS type B sorting domain-containing protein [Bacteroidota bacterium]